MIVDNIINTSLAINIVLDFFVAYLDRTTYLVIHEQVAMEYSTN